MVRLPKLSRTAFFSFCLKQWYTVGHIKQQRQLVVVEACNDYLVPILGIEAVGKKTDGQGIIKAYSILCHTTYYIYLLHTQPPQQLANLGYVHNIHKMPQR